MVVLEGVDVSSVRGNPAEKTGVPVHQGQVHGRGRDHSRQVGGAGE